MKTSTLTGKALDWAVTKCEGFNHEVTSSDWGMNGWATDWSQAGPIIEREGISINAHLDGYEWFARDYWGLNEQADETPLVAAMRCYIASKLGDDVDVPPELV